MYVEYAAFRNRFFEENAIRILLPESDAKISVKESLILTLACKLLNVRKMEVQNKKRKEMEFAELSLKVLYVDTLFYMKHFNILHWKTMV